MDHVEFTPTVIEKEDELKLALKQFFLETQRLENSYQGLQERFKSIQSNLQESHTRFDGKLIELSFTSNYLQTILQQISQGIIFIDLQGMITTYNAAAQNILQLPEQSLLFHHFSQCLRDDFFGFSLQQVFAAQKNVATSWITLKADGKETELEVEAIFIAMSQQNYSQSFRQQQALPIQGLLLLMHDVTKMRHLQFVANRNDRLKELGAMSAKLAHEIRNPLGGIKGFATILKDELHDRKDLQQMAIHIAQGADDLNQFVNHILTYSRPCHLQLEIVDVVYLMSEIELLLRADSLWNAKINFSIESSCAQLLLRIDPLLFKSAILNLLVNAIQAMPEGGQLNIRLWQHETWAIIEIEDTGIGIESEHLSNVFSPFFTTKPSGNGLGLAEVYKTIQAHDGFIDVQSAQNQGTKFTIKIPMNP